MKRILLIIACALFLALMGVSCCDCDCGDKGNGENSNVTTETVDETQGKESDQRVETPQPKAQEKVATITKTDIEKVNRFIDEGKCDEAVAMIGSWKDKKPAQDVKLLRDINISGDCAKQVGDAINGLSANVNNNK